MKHLKLTTLFLFLFIGIKVSGQDINKALQYLNNQQYKEAAEEFEKELPAVETKYGDKDTSIYSIALLYTAVSCERSSDYTKAERYYIKCCNVYKSINATKSYYYSTACNNLALLYSNTGNYAKAEPLYIEAKTIYEKVLGKEHSEYGISCYNLAGLYDNISNYKKAEPLYIEAKTIYEKVLGKEHPTYALTCNNLAGVYDKMGNYTKAESLYIEAKTIREKVLGKEHSDYAISCSNLAALYDKVGNYSKAEPLYIEAKRVNEKLLGRAHPDYAKSCSNLAALYQKFGNYAKAEPLIIEAKTIRENVLGKEHVDYVRSCSNLAGLYDKMGNYAKAEPLYIEAKQIWENLLGKEHSYYALSCDNLAGLYNELGNYAKAETLYIEAKIIREKVLGEEHPDYAGSCSNLAGLYDNMGNYTKAETLYIEAKKINERVLGKEHPDYAKNCGNFAALYDNMGDYAKAEPLYIEAKKIIKKVLGKEHPDYALSCNNLAVLYDKIGNYAKAEPLYIEAKNIYEKVLGTEHPHYAASCNNIAGLYNEMKNYTKAEPLYIEAKNIYEKVLGKEHPDYATSCNNLALLYDKMGNYAKAEPLYIVAKTIYEKVLGQEHPIYATSCNNLALLYSRMGNYAKAEPLYIKAKTIREQVLGKKHLDYATSCNNLAGLYEDMENYSKAEPLILEADEIFNFLSSESSKFMSEQEREKYLNTKINYKYDIFHSFYLKHSTNKELTARVYNNSLRNKGRLLRSVIAMRKAVLQSGDTSMITNYNKMNEIGQILIKEYSKSIANRRSDIKKLEETKNILEKNLVRKTANNIVHVADWKNIQQNLKNGETAIEFVHFRYRNQKRLTDSTLYYALLLQKDYTYPKAIFLFEQKQLENITNKDNDNSTYKYIKQLYSKKSKKAKSLYQLIWQKLESYLPQLSNLSDKSNLPKIYISPTGVLNSISFDAIPIDTISLLSDKYRIIYTSTTAQVANQISLDNIKNADLFGGLKYDISIDKMKENAIGFVSDTQPNLLPSASTQSGTAIWSYLPSTLVEVEDIEKILSKRSIAVNLYSGNKGSEELFKSIEKNAPDILHIATHGFYFHNVEKDKEDEEESMFVEKKIVFTESDNPLLRSGLLLSGGQNIFSGISIPEGLEDGILTASEISKMNLFNTKLAVLSACQTGLGDVKGNEGVYGLQRAFKMAGVDYLIYTLWEIPDKATQEFMSYFYTQLISNKEINIAFKDTQEKFKEKFKKIPGSAYAWAAFVLMR